VPNDDYDDDDALTGLNIASSYDYCCPSAKSCVQLLFFETVYSEVLRSSVI